MPPDKSLSSRHIKAASQRVWRASPAGLAHSPDLVPGTREFFETVRQIRSTEELPWLWDCFPIATTRGQNVLEVGCGAGFDSYEFCLAGARYCGLDLTGQNLSRTREHLRHYGQTPDLVQADAEQLPFVSGYFDTVFSNGVLHHTPDFSQALTEIRRVLKDGGRLWMTVYHRQSIFYSVSLRLDHLLRLGFLTESMQQRLARIEFTSASDVPLVTVYSRKELQKFLRAAGFAVESVEVRKLTWQDMPGLPYVYRLWKYVPKAWLDRLGRRWGWYLVVRAVAITPGAQAH